jgi:hypothetical protein
MRGDPWEKLPNYGTTPTTDLEDYRAGDPARFYSATRGGQTDAVSERIQNMPRAKMFYAAGNPSYGAGNSFLPFDTKVVDTDNLIRGTTYFTCTTPGVYWAHARLRCGGVAGGNVGVWGMITDPGQIFVVDEATNYGVPAAFGTYMTFSGLWFARAGDQIGFWLSTTATVSVGGGVNSNFFETILLSTYGSDN